MLKKSKKSLSLALTIGLLFTSTLTIPSTFSISQLKPSWLYRPMSFVNKYLNLNKYQNTFLIKNLIQKYAQEKLILGVHTGNKDLVRNALKTGGGDAYKKTNLIDDILKIENLKADNKSIAIRILTKKPYTYYHNLTIEKIDTALKTVTAIADKIYEKLIEENPQVSSMPGFKVRYENPELATYINIKNHLESIKNDIIFNKQLKEQRAGSLESEFPKSKL